MGLTRQELAREAAGGFAPEVLEKAIRLLAVLDDLRSHPYLKSRIALKGGTALNLFVFDVPRLSVNIDLNYVGGADRQTMLSERPRVESAVQAVCERAGLGVRRLPKEHAGGRWRLRFASVVTASGNLELDMNFLLRAPLWPVEQRDSRPLGAFRATGIPMLDIHELAAGKLAALLSRGMPRDVFDSCELLRGCELDQVKLRLAFVVYGGANRRDWRSVSTDDVLLDPTALSRELLPTLRVFDRPDPAALAGKLTEECRERLGIVLPLRSAEIEFMTALNERGEIAPDLLTSDAQLQSAIGRNPALLWKAANVREHNRGASRLPFPSWVDRGRSR